MKESLAGFCFAVPFRELQWAGGSSEGLSPCCVCGACAGGVCLILWSCTNPRLSLKASLSRAEEPLEVWVPYLSVFFSFAQLPTSFALTKQDGVYCLITEAAESGLVSRVIVVSAKKQN